MLPTKDWDGTAAENPPVTVGETGIEGGKPPVTEGEAAGECMPLGIWKSPNPMEELAWKPPVIMSDDAALFE